MSRVNVLVLAPDQEPSVSSQAWLVALKSSLAQAYDVQLASLDTIRREPWQLTCALVILIAPSATPAADLEPRHLLAADGILDSDAAERILRYVASGAGAYLALTTGQGAGTSVDHGNGRLVHLHVSDDVSAQMPRLQATLALLGLDAATEDGMAPSRPTHILVSEPSPALASSSAIGDAANSFVFYSNAEDAQEAADSESGISFHLAPASTSAASAFSLARYRERLSSEATFGSTLLVADATTSTQTVMEKNPKLLAALPDGAIFVASHQLAGRGRQHNSWISSKGCLQFSFVVRAPESLASKLVFVQYLVGLAIVEAVRSLPGYSEVGLQLKWPNDIYANVGSPRTPRLVKVGGILVNSSFHGGHFSIVVGCGVNVSNPKPTTSINEAISIHNIEHAAELGLVQPEDVLAAFATQMDAMWPAFMSQAFTPFYDRYISRWIHSDQQVHIEATGEAVKIVGLTLDHGLLRTVPVANLFAERGAAPSSRRFIDLQPDGNGFDMLKGLLVSRK